MEKAAHIVTDEGRTFAVTMSGDTIDFAIEVESVHPDDLADQVNEAVVSADSCGLADWLTELLAYGRASVIGAYFEVSV